MKNIGLVLLCIVCQLGMAQDEKVSKVVYDSIKVDVVTKNHTLTTSKGTLKYRSTTGYLSLTSETGEEQGRFFFIAYTADTKESVEKRPLSFAFNGGPGSASLYLHLGALGPKKVVLDKEGFAGTPPYGLEDNPETWLYKTDLVFIDPIGTGYSRAMDKSKSKASWGYKNDIKSVGKFIHRYMTQYDRWSSPKFIVGESYGTTRASGLALHLMNVYGIHVNGVMMVSTVLNFQTLFMGAGNELPYTMFLPSYTATAWFHKKLPAELQALSLEEVVAKSRGFASTQYQLALFAGNNLSQEKRESTAKVMSQLLGVSPDFVIKSKLRITPSAFRKELLAKDGLSVGRYDSRYTLEEYNTMGSRPSFDASSEPWVDGPFNHGINDYLSRDLGYKKDLKYNIFNAKVWPWDFSKNEYLDVSDELSKALTANPNLRIHFFNGYYDLATPFFATEYTIDHFKITGSRRKNISSSYYESGHMMYLRESELIKFTDEANKFIESAR